MGKQVNETSTVQVTMEESGVLQLADLNPDIDGDGQVGKFEMELFSQLKAADVDGNGRLTQAEFWSFLKDQLHNRRESNIKMDSVKREASLFKKALVIATILIFLLVGAVTGLTVVVVSVFKDQYTAAGSGLVTNKNGDVVRSASPGMGAAALDSRRRRMRTVQGRRLVSVATVDETTCLQRLADAKKSHESCGNVAVSSDGDNTVLLFSGCAESYDNDGKVISGTSSTGVSVTVDNCADVLVATSRLRELSLVEAAEPARHRRLSSRMLDAFKPVHEGCVVFHCFEGEDKCEEPSPPTACLKWEEDKKTCAVPLCKYIAAGEADEL